MADRDRTKAPLFEAGRDMGMVGLLENFNLALGEGHQERFE